MPLSIDELIAEMRERHSDAAAHAGSESERALCEVVALAIETFEELHERVIRMRSRTDELAARIEALEDRLGYSGGGK